ncbi:hypothetical protein HMPREF0262_01316 [Clostridium sp. ATCC 29733]|nr:hypothetical protein HMPREF0262_01316 [Clostridium sp. ATCC 29733]
MRQARKNGRAGNRKNGDFGRAKAAEIARYDLPRDSPLCCRAAVFLPRLAKGPALCLCGRGKSIF